MSQSLYDFTVTDAKGRPYPLEQHRGQPILIINVASQCGFTPQYEGLEALYRKYKDQGLVMLAFPCNQFNGQEPGTDAQIQDFCQLNYGLSFPVLSKVDVNGAQSAPIYSFLKKAAPGLLGSEAIKWNFTKFLIQKDGTTVERFAPTTTPDKLEAPVSKSL